MNEVFDPRRPVEGNEATEANLSETPQQEEVENVVSEQEVLPAAEPSGEDKVKPAGEAETITEKAEAPEKEAADTTAEAPEANVAEEEAAKADAETKTDTAAEETKAEDAAEAEANPEESVAEEEAAPAEDAPREKENEPEGDNASKVAQIAAKMSRHEIIERIQLLIEDSIEKNIKIEIDFLKQAYYKLRKNEVEEARKDFIAEGGKTEEFVAPEDDTEEKLKELLTKFRDKRAELMKEEDRLKETNLIEKKAILEEIKNLIDSQDDFNKIYNEFRRLQLRWKELKQIPQAQANELWREYQLYSEKFYDLLKINNEMRIYDFKKNLELKNALIEAVEKLDEEPDVVSAFHQLQKFHHEWREIGPVSKELREEVWARFKEASSVINKKHQAFFENLRGKEQENLQEKTELCEKIEAIDYEALNSFKAWDEMNKYVLNLQQKWKTIGFAPKKHNIKIFERFRAGCDVFFQKKSDFYREVKSAMEENLEKKKVLCEKAEALKDSTEWKETTEKMIALQKEWKTIGAVSRKHSDLIWKRFISACDHFFEEKNKNFSSHKTEELENLQLKKDLIAKIDNIDESLESEEAMAILRELMAEWNNIGHVPFRNKDKIYKEYRTAVDKHFDRMKIDQAERRLQSFRSNINDMASGEKPKGKLLNERDKLMRTFEKLKNDIQTYENNIGFLSVTSKGGGGLLKEMDRKIEELKAEQELVLKKIQAIDDNLE